MCFSNEEKVLLLTSKPSMNRTETLELRKLEGNEINWAKVVRLAKGFRVFPSVYLNLKKSSKKIPKKALMELKKEFFYFNAQKMVLEGTLKKLIKLLKKKGIKTMVLKGASFHFYSKKWGKKRHYSDLDLLFKTKDLYNAVKFLKQQGFTEFTEKTASFPKKMVFHGNPLKKETQGIPCIVEPHWNLSAKMDPFTINEESLWNESLKTKIVGERILVLSHEAQLVHLCIHLAYLDCLKNSLKNLVDLHEIIKSKKVGWKKVTSLSREWQCSAFVSYSLGLLKETFPINIPSRALKELKKDANPSHLKRLQKIKKNPFTGTKGPALFFRLYFVNLPGKAKMLWRGFLKLKWKKKLVFYAKTHGPPN